MLASVINLARRLDCRAFLGFRLWQFSLLNLRRAFSWFFLLRIMLLHPAMAVRGIRRYRRLVRESLGARLAGTMEWPAVLQKGSAWRERVLIAPGFCLKPYDQSKGGSLCPVGHFNHDCMLLNDARAPFLSNIRQWPTPCRTCGIPPLATLAADIGADIYIMTSAMDIARDVYVPAITGRGARAGLFFLCPYSVEPFTFGLATSGISGSLVEFCRGDCKNHEDWTRADVGYKSEQTSIDKNVWRRVQRRAGHLSHDQNAEKCGGYEKQGHVYRFCSAAK